MPTIAPAEIAQFARHAADWWNPDGAFKPLHRLNPVRLGYIKDRVGAHFGLQESARRPFEGLKALDVGCGGGLLAEPLARLGAAVTGLDAAPEAIAVARDHAKSARLDINYVAGDVEGLARGTARYDLVTALEIAEHVADLEMFVKALAKLLKPGGLLIMSTLNRTPKSFLLGIVAAEYVLGWVPRGTHDWKKFLRPSELVARLEAHGLSADDLTGLIFNPLRDEFQLSAADLEVNYLLSARKA